LKYAHFADLPRILLCYNRIENLLLPQQHIIRKNRSPIILLLHLSFLTKDLRVHLCQTLSPPRVNYLHFHAFILSEPVHLYFPRFPFHMCFVRLDLKQSHILFYLN